jgi:hypothetical protein
LCIVRLSGRHVITTRLRLDYKLDAYIASTVLTPVHSFPSSFRPYPVELSIVRQVHESATRANQFPTPPQPVIVTTRTSRHNILPRDVLLEGLSITDSPHHDTLQTTSQLHLFTCWPFHVLFNSLFKVLFNFPSRYLFTIGLTEMFSLSRSLPATLGCTLKQPDSNLTGDKVS